MASADIQTIPREIRQKVLTEIIRDIHAALCTPDSSWENCSSYEDFSASFSAVSPPHRKTLTGLLFVDPDIMVELWYIFQAFHESIDTRSRLIALQQWPLPNFGIEEMLYEHVVERLIGYPIAVTPADLMLCYSLSRIRNNAPPASLLKVVRLAQICEMTQKLFGIAAMFWRLKSEKRSSTVDGSNVETTGNPNEA